MSNTGEAWQPLATADSHIDPTLRATILRDCTDAQIEAANRRPSLEDIFSAHLKLMELQDVLNPRRVRAVDRIGEPKK